MSQTSQKEFRKLKSNFISLSILQAGSYILPLLTFAYLVQVLGIEKFGLLAFATALIAYFGILTDYGFNLTATKEISLYQNNQAKTIEIFSSVMTIKFFLLLLSFLILSILLISISALREHWEIYLLTFGNVIGQFLFPVWFFQGKEEMNYITTLTLISKSLFTIAIFLFVKNPNDIYLVPLFFSMGSMVAGVISLTIIYKKFQVSFKFQTVNKLKSYLKEGWYVFISRFYVSLYTTTNVIILGVFTNNILVGYYAIAEKIVLAIAGIFTPINQTIYPYLSRKYKEDFQLFVAFIKRTSLLFVVLSSLFILLAQLFNQQLVHLIHGSYEVTISYLLSIFLLRVLTYPFGGLLSNSLIIMNQNIEYIRVMNYTVLLNFLLVPISIYYFEAMGLIIAFLVVTSIHVMLLYYYVNQSIQFIKEKY